MAIPASQPPDVVLAYLLRAHPEQIGDWLPLEAVAGELVPFFAGHKAPGFVFNPHPPPLPAALMDAFASLERRLYVELNHELRQVRLTPLGSVVALMHDLPAGLRGAFQATEQ
jgi:hypothetical protein